MHRPYKHNSDILSPESIPPAKRGNVNARSRIQNQFLGIYPYKTPVPTIKIPNYKPLLPSERVPRRSDRARYRTPGGGVCVCVCVYAAGLRHRNHCDRTAALSPLRIGRIHFRGVAPGHSWTGHYGFSFFFFYYGALDVGESPGRHAIIHTRGSIGVFTSFVSKNLTGTVASIGFHHEGSKIT